MAKSSAPVTMKISSVGELDPASKNFEQFFISDCAKVLIDAEKIKKNPALVKLVAKELEKQSEAINAAKGCGCSEAEEESEGE